MNTDSTSHDEWLKKFSKTKEGKMFDLRHEFDSLNSRFVQKADHLSYLANALWISAKGTKHESDAKHMIEEICPQFFEK